MYLIMDGYSTREAAKQLGIGFSTLTKYVGEGKIPLPPLTRVGGVRVRLWSEKDIQRLRQLLPKIGNGRNTRYLKKPRPKAVHGAPGSSTVPHKKKK